MSLKIVVSDIEVPENESSKEVAERMNEKLHFFAQRHPEFSYEIAENRDENKLVIKTVMMIDGTAN